MSLVILTSPFFSGSQERYFPIITSVPTNCSIGEYRIAMIPIWSLVYFWPHAFLVVNRLTLCLCQQWLKLTTDDVVEQIIKLAKKGMTPSQIGVMLRDWHGVAQVRWVTGNKILRILKSKGLAPALPEDLYHLIKKAVAIRKHLERNRKDRDSKFRLILVESRIHRLARYYKTNRVLPPTWKYESSTASALVA